jgi:hypothetical protein
LCGGTNSADGHKGGERCCEGRTTIHKSAIESIANHRGVDNSRSITKGDGDGVVWNGSGSKEKTCNPRHSYTPGERYLLWA